MAGYSRAVPHPGALWQEVLRVWDIYATGAYDSFTFSYAHPTGGYNQWTIHLAVTGGGTDDYVLYPVDVEWTESTAPLMYVIESIGWRTFPTTVYPDPLSNGHEPYYDFYDGPRALRHDIVQKYCTVGSIELDEWYSGTRFGTQVAMKTDRYVKDLIHVVDACGILFGASTVDAWTGIPTDGIVNTPPSAASSGGGSVDITPLVGPLQDIALRDVSYSFNNGGTIFNSRGKVNV